VKARRKPFEVTTGKVREPTYGNQRRRIAQFAASYCLVTVLPSELPPRTVESGRFATAHQKYYFYSSSQNQ